MPACPGNLVETAAKIATDQRQQEQARADAARHQDEDDVESLLMSFP